VTRLQVATRAQVAAWRGTLTRTRDAAAVKVRRRTSDLLVWGGAAGMLAGAAIVGTWLLGLTLMAEAGFAAYVGLNREDGGTLPARGSRYPSEVLEDERRYP
jgi:hypothetical protein